MNETCKKCGAVIEHDRRSTDEAPAMLIYACGTVLFADGSGVEGHCCLSNQIAAKDAEIAGLKAELATAQAAINHLSPSCASLLARAEAAEAELVRYTGPLTDNQVASLADGWALPSAEFRLIDAAIRAARDGAQP